MRKYVISVFLLVSIISCSAEEQEALDDFIEIVEFINGDDEEQNGADAGTNSTNSNERLTVTGFGETVTVNSEKKTDLILAGSNNTVIVETDLGELRVSGSNNLLRFSPNTSVDFCTVAGSDNTAQRDDSVSIRCDINGSGNMGF